MAEVDPVILELIAKNGRYIAEMTRAERISAQKMGNIERMGGRMSSSLSRSFNLAAASAAAFVTVGLAREFLRYADTAKQLEAQLRLATRESGNFAQAQEDVRSIALSTRSELDATAKLYGNFQRNALDLGITQEEVARATETVAKTFKISGAGSIEAAQATRQLVQALQSGVLRGDEFNSVMESSPRLTRLLAESLGIPIGQLRAMAEEGELTSDKLVRAFTDTKFTKGIDAEFAELPVTFDQAMQQVENAAIITFGAFDRGGQFSTALANFITDGTTGFADLEVSAENFGRTMSSEIAGIIAVTQGLMRELSGLGAFLDTATLGAGSFIANNAKYLMPGRLALEFIRSTPVYQNAGQARAAELAPVEQGGLTAAFANMREVAQGGRPRPAPAAGGGKSNKRSGPSAETLARRAEQERLRAIREDAAKQQDLARLNDDLLAARAALATASDDVLKFELQQIDSRKEQDLARLRTEVALGDLTKDEYDQRAALIEKEARLRGQALLLRKAETDAAAAALQERVMAEDELGTLEAEAELARTREERARLEREILDKAYDLEEQAIRQQAAAGEIADLDEALANMRRRRLADEQILARSMMSPGQRYLDDLRTEAENLGDAYEEIAVRGLDRMNDAFADSIKNALGLHGVLGDIIGDFIELAIRQQILGPLGGALFGGGGGGGLLGNILGAVLGSAGGGRAPSLPGLSHRASGGPVSAGRPYIVGERGEELFVPRSPGFVVPNQQLQGGMGGGGISVVRLELSGDIDARIRRVSGPVAIEVVRATAPQVIDAAAGETMRRAGRPSL